LWNHPLSCDPSWSSIKKGLPKPSSFPFLSFPRSPFLRSSSLFSTISGLQSEAGLVARCFDIRAVTRTPSDQSCPFPVGQVGRIWCEDIDFPTHIISTPDCLLAVGFRKGRVRQAGPRLEESGRARPADTLNLWH
ncbi:hypothetical protein T310_6276, partial [Rasamsonia emersonii CBS 393.64]